MKYKYLVLIFTLMLGLAGCPKSTSTNVPPPPPIVPPVVEPSLPTIYSINNIQSTVAKTCGTCGNTGGQSNSADAVYNQTLNVSDAPAPNSGKVTLFDIAAKAPYANAYWYWPHTYVTDPKMVFNYEFSIFIPKASLDASQAIEFEMQVARAGDIYNYAYQFELHSKTMRVFDYTARAWTVIPVSTDGLTPDTWHHIIARNRFDATTKKATLETITIDYAVHNVNVTHIATPKGSHDHFTNAFQLDSNKLMAPYKVFVDKMRLTWYAVN